MALQSFVAKVGPTVSATWLNLVDLVQTAIQAPAGGAVTIAPVTAGGATGPAAISVAQTGIVTIGSVLSGTFTATGVGFTAAPTTTALYFKIGQIVVLQLPTAGITGTSNSTSFSISGLPAAIQPATNAWQEIIVYATDNSATVAQASAVVGSGAPTGSGTITMIKQGVVAGWTASGTKGAGFNMVYLVN